MPNQNAPRVESSTETLPIKPQSRAFNLTGLEDVPRSIIPVTFYKFVQPSSEKVILPNGERAHNGSFLMPDIREAVNDLHVIILRAKRATRIVNDEKVVSLKILAINLARQKPFILSVPITSFGALGKVFEEMELTHKALNIWDYAVHLEGEEITKVKDTDEGRRPVTYSVINATIEGPVTEPDRETAHGAYQDFAEKLDRDEDEDDLAELAGKK